MQCLFDCIAKRHRQFSLLSVHSDLDSIYHNHLSAFQVEKQKNMSTNCDDHCISCVSGDKEQKYKKWHVFSGNPILLHKGTVRKKKRLSLNGCQCPIRKVRGYHAKKKTPMSCEFQKRKRKKKILVFIGAVKDGSDTKLVWGKYRGDTFETCFSQQ